MKTKAMKKLLLLTACLTLLVLTVVGMTLTASAETYSGTCGTNVTWELDTTTGELTISGTGAMTDYSSSSSSRAPWYSYYSSIKTVIIEDGVTSIGDYAFNGCSSLTSITISDSVTSIGYDAFRYCSSLTNITIPNSVTSISDYAFYYCNSLTSITIGDGVTSIGDYAFYGCSSLTSITIPNNVKSIGSYAFQYCYRLVEVYNLSTLTITAGLDTKGYVGYYAKQVHTSADASSGIIQQNDYVFYNHNESYYLVRYTGEDTAITLPNDVNGNSYSINQHAFRGCTALTNVAIPDSVMLIDDYAFYNCSTLTTISISESVKTIGTSVFTGCSSLESIQVDSNNINYCSQNGILYNNPVTTFVHIPANLSGSVSLLDGITSINSNAFENRSNLTSITIPNSVTSVGSYAFSGCSSLTSATIGNGVTSIGNSAFLNCSSLTSITIPNSVTSIGRGAFEDCSKLTSITLPFVSGDYFGYIFDANSYSSNSSYVPSSLTTVTLTNATTIPSNAFKGCSYITTVRIRNHVTSIGSSAFSGCTALKRITLGNDLVSIGSSAFYNCTSLTSTSFDLPDAVTTIGAGAFSGCTNLIVTENNVSYVDNWVVGCDSAATSIALRDGTVGIIASALSGKTALTNVTLPTGLLHISASAFSSCTALTDVTVPNSVLTIGSSVFSGCSALESISLPFVGTADNSASNPHFGYIFGASSHTTNGTKVPASLKKVAITSGTTIASYAFFECASIEEIVLADSITSIGMYAFQYCEGLKSIDLSNGITSIEEGTFQSCYMLNAIVLPEGVTSIATTAFEDCTALKTVVLPSTLQSIAPYVFSFCDSLETVIYCGTTEAWDAIDKDYDWDADANTYALQYHGLADGVCQYCGYQACAHSTTHTVRENYNAPDCKNNGNYDIVTYCSDCEKEISRTTVPVSALGHTDPNSPMRENYVPATCVIPESYDLVYYCTVCGDQISRKSIVNEKAPHTPSAEAKENQVGATCTATGSYDSVVYCLDCGVELSRKTEIISALGHSSADAVEENRINPTCQEVGSYESVVYCSVCEVEISRTIIVIPVGDHTYSNGICTVCGVWDGITQIAIFDGVNLAIGQDITIKYYVTINANLPDVKLVFNMGDKTATVVGVATGVANQYAFAFEGVSPQCMGDAITAKLYSSTDLIAEKGAYTVKTYLKALINGDYDEKTKAIAKDTLIYGGAAQVYKNYNTDAIVSDGITGSSYPLPSKSGIELSNGTGATFTNATVWFDNINKIRVKFTADSTENLIVKINGVETEYVLGDDGKYYVHTEALLATEFDKFFTFEIYINGTLVSSLKYSVNSYVYTMLSSTNEPMKNLAIALYNYGYSADIYNGTPQTPMVSEDELIKGDPTKSFQGEEHLFTPFG